MSSKANFFLKKTLGEDFLQSLEKFELWKPNSKIVLDHEEIKTALKIVPRTILSFLVKELVPMNIGENKKVHLPIYPDFPENVLMHVTKIEKDVYNGEIEDSTEKYTNKKVAEFKYRSVPGIGLVIMSAFELYNPEELEEEPKEIPADTYDRIQKLIDERLALNDLVGRVVDKKLSERDAIQQLILAKVNDSIKPNKQEEHKPLDSKFIPQKLNKKNDNFDKIYSTPIEHLNKKNFPLKDFLEKRKNKLHKNEYKVELVKGELVHCPDCGKNIFDGKIFSNCICFGDDRDKKLYLKKHENGYKIRFGRGWDIENIDMLLDILRKKHG